MVDNIFDRHPSLGHSSEASELVDLLKSSRVELWSVARFTIAFNSIETIRAFVSEWSLSEKHEELLAFAVDKLGNAADSEVDWRIWRSSLEKRSRADSSSSAVGRGFTINDPCTSSKVRKLETMIRKADIRDVGKTPSSVPAGSGNPPVTLSSVRTDERTKVEKLCLSLFHRVGSICALYVEIFGADGRHVPPDAMLGMLRDLFFTTKGAHKLAEPATVRAYCRHSTIFLDWLDCMNLRVECVTVFQVAAFIRDRAPLGKSVPERDFFSLRWFHSVTGVCVHTDHPMVEGQAKKVHGETALRDAPKQAKCPPRELVEKIELCCCSKSEPLMVCVVAGLLCCLVHGTLRWSDAQRTCELRLEKDLVMGKAVMKRKSELTPWVATRTGFSKNDWGGAWFEAMQQFGMPGPDFLLFEPQSVCSVKCIPASYSTMMNYMRIVLCRACVGLSSQ